MIDWLIDWLIGSFSRSWMWSRIWQREVILPVGFGEQRDDWGLWSRVTGCRRHMILGDHVVSRTEGRLWRCWRGLGRRGIPGARRGTWGVWEYRLSPPAADRIDSSSCTPCGAILEKSILKLLVFDAQLVMVLQPTVTGFGPFWKIGCNFSSVG